VKPLRFDGRVAVVTGAGRGIGRAYARLLASRGAAVLVNDLGGRSTGDGRSEAPANEVVSDITDRGGQAVANHQSVATAEGAQSIIDDALSAFGRLDIVICNAGIADPKPFAQMGAEDFERMLAVHFFGAMRVIKAAWPHLERAGYGRIVNTCSPTLLGMPGFSSYGSAKGAVFGLTRALATEAPAGVCVNAISPGAYTRMADDAGMDAETIGWMSKALPAELAASVAAYLAHDSCSLNGEVITAQAGVAARWLIGEVAGYRDAALSPEDVAENIDRIEDVSGFRPFVSTQEAMDDLIKRIS